MGTKVSKKQIDAAVAAAAGVVAPSGAGVGSGASASAVSVAPAGVAGGASGRSGRGRSDYASQLQIINNEYEQELKVSALAADIKKYFAVPEWAGAAALRAALQPLVDDGTMTLEQYDATLAAAARKAGVVVPVCSLPRVLAVVRAHFINEFENVCGVSFASVRAFFAGGAKFGVFSLRLNLSLVVADSAFNDFVRCESLAAGASASAVIRAFLSVRFAGAFLAARAAAVKVARTSFFDGLAAAFRAGSKLGVSVKEMQEYLEEISVSVPASDNKDKERLTRSLSRTLRQIAAIEYGSNTAAGLLFYVPSLFDDDFVLRSGAALPAVGVSAKCRKLWAQRVRLLSAADTLRALLARC